MVNTKIVIKFIYENDQMQAIYENSPQFMKIAFEKWRFGLDFGTPSDSRIS